MKGIVVLKLIFFLSLAALGQSKEYERDWATTFFIDSDTISNKSQFGNFRRKILINDSIY